jgi:hypothetical protein
MWVTREIFMDNTVRRAMVESRRDPPEFREMMAKLRQESSTRRWDIFRALLAAGANPNAKSKKGGHGAGFRNANRE